MEGASSSMAENMAESGNSNSVNLEEIFITLQTKGCISKQIPLIHFLEKVIGKKLDSDIRLKIMSFLMVENNSAEVETDTNPISSSDIDEAKSINFEVPQVKEPIVKSKGRGRPRKTKAETKGADRILFESLSSSDLSINPKDDEMDFSSSKAKIQLEATPSLRRSTRVPTKNSKFKDDFVDSSIISSKASSSGDTRLMTLALAAECHTTKPSNKQSIPLAQSQSRIDQQIEGNSLSSNNCEKLESNVNNYCETDQNNSQANNDSTMRKHTLIDCVLERKLQSQLDLCMKATKFVMTEKPIAQDSGNKKYYVLCDTKQMLHEDAILVQKFSKGIQFSAADVYENVQNQLPRDVSSTCTSPKYFKCVLCDKIFATAFQLQRHNKQEHSSKSVNIPGKSLSVEKVSYDCSLCGQRFPFKFMLDHHLAKQEKCNIFTCLVCSGKFSSQKEQEEHRTSAHPPKKCATCNEYFDDVAVFTKHFYKCKSSISSHDKPISPNSLEENQKLTFDQVVKSKNLLTSHEEEVYRQREEKEIIESESADKAETKVGCELCGLKFSTYSGLWHHKLDTHKEYFPPGLKEKLEMRLEKTQQMLSSVSHLNTYPIEDTTKSNFFVIMKPKWFRSKMQLKASVENRKLNFISAISKSKSDSSLNEPSTPGNSISPPQKGVLFHCNQCSTHYLSASDYREHRSKAHNECFESVRYLGAFQCTYCSDTFPCQFMLNQHLKQHTGRRLLPCTLCGLNFHKIQERRLHWKQVHPGVGCPNCGKMYASIKYLQKHISSNCQDHYPATKKFIAFRKKQHNDFSMDEKDKRVEKRLIKCHLCPKICSSVHGWRRHMSDNHEDKGFSKLSNTCIICNEVIYGYKALEKHLLEVHAEDSGLPIEEENTIIKQAVEKSQVHINEYQKAGKSYPDIYQDEEGMFHCPECPKTHSDVKAIQTHIKTHVNMQLECSLCKKSFKNPSLLKQHVMRHRTTAVYNCDTCGKKFLTLQKLNKHNKVHHSNESFVCELCGMSFALNDYLLKHKRSHTDKRPHSCSVCGKTFRTKPELRVHILIHTQETPYICEHCGRGFTQKGNWRIHLAQHTGVKPHKCHLCDLSFALPSHLKRHLLTHNQKINYRCVWCDKECTQRKHMQMHVSRVHKEDFFQYEEQMKLDNPVPIAPSQMKIYNRRLGKAGQVRKAYRTRAKKCNSSIQDILDGIPVPATGEEISESTVDIKPMIVETNEETVTPDISIVTQDITADNMQILVSEDHQNYVKHDIPPGLIEEDGSNVEIVMGDNNEINIIINNAENAIGTDLALQDSLDETGPVSLTHFTDASGQLPSSLQQAVNALVAGQKGEDGEVVDDATLPLDMDAMIAGDNYTIVYPSGT